MKTLPLLLLLAAVFAATGFQCGRGPVEEPKLAHEFAGKLRLTPYRKTYALGDTITVAFATADKRLFDNVTQAFVGTDTARLRVGFYYHQRFPIGRQPEFSPMPGPPTPPACPSPPSTPGTTTWPTPPTAPTNATP